MLITLKVPSIACEVCAQTIKDGIVKHQPASQVKVDVTNKIVTVETTASEAEIRDIIISVGHELA
jgi:copper chaperone